MKQCRQILLMLILICSLSFTEENKVLKSVNSKVESIINAIDRKVNPELRFYTPDSYGKWYLVYTTKEEDQKYENVMYDFTEQGLGYNIKVDSYVLNEVNDEWINKEYRGWIEEKGNKVYLKMHKTPFTNYNNLILYFDRNDELFIFYSAIDDSIKVLSREMKLSEEKEIEVFAFLEPYMEKGLSFYNIIQSSDIKNPRLQVQEEKYEEILSRMEKFTKDSTIDYDSAVELN